MVETETTFDYVAIDAAGRRIKGQLAARSDAAAFERLKRDGLSPVSLRAGVFKSGGESRRNGSRGLTEREAAEFLGDLAALLSAGADMRNALSILGARGGRPSVKVVARQLAAEIGGGGALDLVFSQRLGRKQTFVGALVAAGEAAGDLAGGLKRAADMLASRIKLKDQLVSALSYPSFVLVSTVVAMAVILLFVAPSLAPLADDAGGQPPVTLAFILGLSQILRSNLTLIGIGAGLSGVGLLVAARMGALTPLIETALLDGPLCRTAGGLVFGGFSIALGDMLSAGAPMSEALRLAMRSVRWTTARARLEAVAHAVRQGESLSGALGRVRAFPDTVVRLATVGEASGALGAMLRRAGQLEEEAALRRIESAGRILGPVLIIGLGGLIGLMMAGLLSGVSQLGQAALQ